MAARDILLLGNPILRTPCTQVRNPAADEVRATAADLADTLAKFRQECGFGRGIAAPQIGVSERIIYLHYEITGPMINPRIVRRSRAAVRMWDDCFSFPDIMVEVKRNASVTVEYRDGEGVKRTVQAAGGLSELLQHEIDHLDGILAIDRAIGLQHIMLRSEYERHAHAHRNMM